jgi:hypothetical protein
MSEMPEMDEELQRQLRLVGPDGDPESQQLWLALYPCVVLGHALLRSVETAIFVSVTSTTTGPPDPLASKKRDVATELHAHLYFALNHTPLAEERRRQSAMKSRERWTSDGAQGYPMPDEEAHATKVAYRRYSLSTRTVEFRAAADIARVLLRLVRFADQLILSEQVRSLARQLVAALEAAKPRIESYAKVVKRMSAMERLGGLA